MAMNKTTSRIDQQYINYINSGCWKCPDAPILDIPLQIAENSGAHYWKEFHGGKKGEFYCKYCFTIRLTTELDR